MMKRIGSLLLAILLLCSTVVLFASCGKVDISGYSIVYADGVSDTMVAKVKELANVLELATGAEVTVTADKKKEGVTNSEREILIGHTGRVESAEALESLEEAGYYIGVIDKKIVLNGTTDFFAMQAVNDFIATYFADSAKSATSLKIKEEVVALPTLSLSSSFALVISHTADNSYAEQGINWGRPSNEQGEDYARYLASTFADKVVSHAGELKLYDDQSEVQANEIQIGRPVLREATKSFFANLDANDYGISIKDGVIVVGAMNDTTLALAMKMFDDLYTDCTYKVGRKTYTVFPAEYEVSLKGDSSWVLDFPRPTGANIALSGSADVYDGSLEFLYTGKGVNAAAYESYCETLTSGGYTLHSSGEIEGSLYRTYVNTAANTTLYVAYNNFTYAKEQKVSLFESCIRIVSASLNSVKLLDEELLTMQPYTKKTETKITNLCLDGKNENGGNAYIITLEDGTFAVLDGGTGEKALTNTFWNVLADLYYQVWKVQPSSTNKVKISMWYLSHSHGDHHTVFYNFCHDHGSKVEIDRLIANFPSDDECYNCHDPNLAVRDSKFAEIRSWVGGEMQYIKVHTGQKFYLCNSEFEVLYTHEDMYPWAIQYFNDTGVVIKQTIHDTGSVGSRITAFAANDTPTTMLWTGDVQTRVSQWMRAMYGSYLKSDMVQVSHHGSLGCEYAFYALTEAEILWWPTYLENYKEIIKPIANTESYRNDNAKLVKMASVEEIILGSAGNATVTIKTSGPDMTFGEGGIYNAGHKSYVTSRTPHFIKP
ncbi:MAG: hypothetical protein IJW51_06880 [Clostridia bacterium]|nr:hypothetical protein [Clostridia bacterium]